MLYEPGDVAADGSFELRTHWVAEGAPAGRYAVTVRWHPRVVSGETHARSQRTAASVRSSRPHAAVRSIRLGGE